MVNEKSSSFPKGSHTAKSSKHIEGENNTETDTKKQHQIKKRFVVTLIIIIKKTTQKLFGAWISLTGFQTRLQIPKLLKTVR